MTEVKASHSVALQGSLHPVEIVCGQQRNLCLVLALAAINRQTDRHVCSNAIMSHQSMTCVLYFAPQFPRGFPVDIVRNTIYLVIYLLT